MTQIPSLDILPSSRILKLFDLPAIHTSIAMKRTFDMALPDELTINVRGHMGKRNLKNARLACKTLAQYASEPLFDRLYISPREEDIRVVKLITQHPQLRRCVGELEYGAARFSSSLSTLDYFIRLMEFHSRDNQTSLRELDEFHPGQYPDSEVDDL